jgi:sRNA-binding protein
MFRKVLAVLLLSLAATACESNSSETNNASPSPAARISPTPAPSPTTEATPVAQWKAGDKVNVAVNGKSVAATIVSIDEKVGKATVKVEGEIKERAVNLADISKP